MTAYETEAMPSEQISSAADLRDRLVPPIPGSVLWGWLGPLLVTAFGTFLRFDRLSTPPSVVFDETYYAGDAYGILRHGVEINHVKNINTLLAQGKTNIFAPGGELVVHPPLGKIMMAVGDWLFGLTPFGWRFTVALVGSLAILMTARIARRMTRSTLLGCVAGLLLALDGLELVMSRTALLDIFVMFWVLAAFGCLVIDRDRARARIAAAAASMTADAGGPNLGVRWWRVPRPRRRVQVERCVVPARVRAARPGLGPGRAPRRGVRHSVAGCAGARRDLDAGVVRARAAGRLPGLMERLVRLALRLRPQLGGPARQQHAGLVGPRLPVPIQQVHAPVRPRADDRAPVQVAAVDLAGHQQAGLVLLPDTEDLRRAVLLPGGPRDRHAAHLVREHPGDPGVPRVVADPPGLAGRRGAAVPGRRAAAVVLVRRARTQDRV